MSRQSSISAQIEAGRPDRLGAHFDGEGTNFAVFSEHGREVRLCLFSEDGRREVRTVPLAERTGSVWHGYVPGLQPGTPYGYRVEGPYAPERGHRFNPNKLLIDPYTREFFGRISDHPANFGFRRDAAEADLSFDDSDNAAHMAKSVVSDPALFPLDAKPLGRSWENTFVYEAHLKGLTAAHPGIPDELRGRFDGLVHSAILDHLVKLGVTSVELLPVQAFKSESVLKKRGLTNFWGYSTIGFFAPEPRYFGPAGVAGVRAMVDRFHEAGIEVILDVVYNHTAEGDHLGPTLSFRGLDNASYYRLLDGQPRYYANHTGCGNTLNVRHPFVTRMILDSLRFWVQAMGVDGFRFDLATTLGRTQHGFDPDGSFMVALRQDQVLSGIKLIAEPWDVGPGGYQLGNFPSEFAEWNDRYRDTIRRFWRGDGHSAQDLGGALLGTADVFDARGRRSWASINFAAAHDGFTLADLTRYERRHNEANGENNADGHHANYSDNFGVEGPTDDPGIAAARARRQRNLLATVFLSQGTPMLLAGDESGNSQGGNNNSFCQDNPVGWTDWEAPDAELIAFVANLSRYRRAHPVLRQSRFLHGGARPTDGQPDVEWRDFDGASLNWRDPGLASLCLHLRGCSECPDGVALSDEVFIAINREAVDLELVLPQSGPRVWQHDIDTSAARQDARVVKSGPVSVPSQSISVFSLIDGPGHG
jgi:isoamylase